MITLYKLLLPPGCAACVAPVNKVAVQISGEDLNEQTRCINPVHKSSDTSSHHKKTADMLQSLHTAQVLKVFTETNVMLDLMYYTNCLCLLL